MAAPYRLADAAVPGTGGQATGQTVTQPENVLCKFKVCFADLNGGLNPAHASEAPKQPQQHENEDDQAKNAT